MADFADNPFRDYLKTMVYYNTEPNDVNGRMENAYQSLLAIEPLWQKFKKAEHKGSFEGLTFEDHVVYASQSGAVTEAEAEQLIHYNALRFDSLLTDVFDAHLQHAQERFNPHTLANAVDKLTDYAQLKKAAHARQPKAQVSADSHHINSNHINNKVNSSPLTSPDTVIKPDSMNHNEVKNIETATGDSNSNHGYKPDGDVELVKEQSALKAAKTQRKFNTANPRAESLNERKRDAESILNERMRNNHNRQNIDKNTVDTSATEDNNKP